MKPVTITELTQLAALLSAGRHAELERAVSQRLAQLPDSGELWKILSVSLGMQGKPALQALTRAAELLGMPRRTFVYKLDYYGIPRPQKGRPPEKSG